MQGDCMIKKDVSDSRPSSSQCRWLSQPLVSSRLLVSSHSTLVQIPWDGSARRAEQGRGVQNGLATDKEGKSPWRWNKEGPRTRVRTSCKTNNTSASPILHRTGPGRDKQTGARASLSLPPGCWGALLLVSLDQRALTPRKMDFPATF